MTKLVGINHIALEVGDLDEALAWYGQFFELKLRGRAGRRMAFVDMGDQFLALAAGRSQSEDGDRHVGLVVQRCAAMKELTGAATELVPTAIEECFALLEAIDEYPAWYPEVVRSVEVLERGPDGRPTTARAQLHVARGPVVKDFDLRLAVAIDRPHTVKLTRVPHEPTDQERFGVTWRLEGASETRIRLELDANLDVPRFLPLGGIGDSIAEGFVAAAARAIAERHD